MDIIINYGASDPTPFGYGVTPYPKSNIWQSFTTHYQSLKLDIMAIRPMNAN